MSGFIAIHRSLWDNDAFAPEPMSEREAWVWMIARAAWKPTKHRVGNFVTDVPRGCFFTTLRDLQKAFRWKSDKRVRRFLAMLENEGMIGRSADAGKTQITICNYDKYQEAGRSADAEWTQRGRSADALKKKGNKGTRKQPHGAGLRPDEVSPDLWGDFLVLREAKKAPLTEGAVLGLRREAEKAGWPLSEAIQLCVTNGWQGFQARYVEGRQANGARREEVYEGP